MILLLLLPACKPAIAEPIPGRPWPAAAGPVRIGDPGVHTIRVAPEVAHTPDPRFHGDPARYAASDEPWRWTEAQRIAAAARDLADLLGRLTCPPGGSAPDPGRSSPAGPRGGNPWRGGSSPEGTVECPPFAVEPWDTTDGTAERGILVGRPEDFGLASPFAPPTPTTREQHALRTVEDGVLVLGVEAAGVELAVWGLARRLGYRWYLPSPSWEVVPRVDAVPRLDVVDPGPRLAARRIVGPFAGPAGRDFAAWATRNGFMGGLQVKSVQGQWGPAADALRGWVDANPGAISRSSRSEAHEGRTAQIKWCPSYRDRQGRGPADLIAREWVAPRLSWPPRKHDNTVSRDLVPLHQGDSTFWAGCADPSTPADRAVALANGVAERLGPDLDRQVGVMAYREVFPGPVKERVRPELFVWLMGGGYMGVRWEDAVARWRQAGARHLGWYGYWNLGPRRLPDESVAFLAVRPRAQEIARLAKDGFEALWIEQDGGFAVGGWWKWLLMDVARDPSGEDPVDRRIDDLVERAFPAEARPVMRRFLRRFDASDRRILLSPEWVGEAYADLRTARAASRGDPAAVRRIEDLLVGVRWIELGIRPDPPASSPEEARRELVGCARDRRMLEDGEPKGDPAPPCPFDDWLRAAPRPAEVEWWVGEEGGYARATRSPGSAATGSYEGDLHGLPRDAALWRIWLDPASGFTIREVCHGVQDQNGTEPERAHVTSPLLGAAGFVLLDPAGREACVASLPPDRRARDLVFAADGAEITPVPATRTSCRDAPRELPLDTGLPPEPTAGCDSPTFIGEGLYTLRSVNHRMGLDYREIDGRVWVSRWDSPFVPYDERRPDAGATWRYFYVPLGQQVVTFYSSGSPCTLRRDRDRARDVDLGAGGPGYRRVDAQGHDGEIWELAACRGVWLVDVPPVVAPRRDQLLVPCALVEDPDHADDVARLGVDVGDCR